MASGSLATTVTVSERQQVILEKLVRSKRSPRELVERSRIVLMSADGLNNAEQARRLGDGVDLQRIRRWRNRWAEKEDDLSLAEANQATDKDLMKRIVSALSDKPRSGAPATFTPEQIIRILAVACEPPSESDLPISHWTPTELAREVIKRRIVGSISPRHVDRFLKGGRHKTTQKQVLDDVKGQTGGSRRLPSRHRECVRYVSERSQAS